MKKNNINLFDTHSHLHSSFFNVKENGQDVAEEMLKKKVFSVVVGVNFQDSQKATQMAKENENIFCSIGLHPADEKKENWNEKRFQELLNKNKKVVSVGECGLDYYWPSQDLKRGKISEADFASEKARQKLLFKKQINFAVKNNLPLMLHVRSFKNSDAHWDVFKILDQKQKEFKNKIKANFHFFTETPEIAREVIKRGYMISLPGVITFINLDESVREIPLESILVETDSPFAAPTKYRGKTNTPLYVEEVVKKISEIKKISKNKVATRTVQNALNFFKITH